MKKAKRLPSARILRRLLDYDPETGKLYWKRRPIDTFASVSRGKAWNTKWAGKEAFTATAAGGYRQGRVNNEPCYAHRVIWKIITGVDADEIDHINGDISDNRWVNLRSVTGSENHRNMKVYRTNKSGVPGVSWMSREQCWRAEIGRSGRNVFLGYFDNFEDAVAARKQAEKGHGFHPNHGRDGPIKN